MGGLSAGGLEAGATGGGLNGGWAMYGGDAGEATIVAVFSVNVGAAGVALGSARAELSSTEAEAKIDAVMVDALIAAAVCSEPELAAAASRESARSLLVAERVSVEGLCCGPGGLTRS